MASGGKLFATLIAHAPREARADLLLSLVLSGEVIDSEVVIQGILETVATAPEKQWFMLESSNYEWTRWLNLVPFMDKPLRAIEALAALPDALRTVRFLNNVVGVFAHGPASETETALFAWAENVPASTRATNGRLPSSGVARIRGTRLHRPCRAKARSRPLDRRMAIAQQLAPMLARFPALRGHLHELLRQRPLPPGFDALAQTLAENLDFEGLFILLKLPDAKRYLQGRLHGLELLVTRRVESREWLNAFDVVPTDASELRGSLLAMTSDGGPDDIAAWCLRLVDEIRDEYGAPDEEPRHPDLASRKPWPTLSPAPSGIPLATAEH